MNGNRFLIDTNILLYVTANKIEISSLPEGEFYVSFITELETLSYSFISAHSDEVKKLAQGYISQNIIPEKHLEDALHMAVASLNKIDFFVTWNCTHIAGAHKRKKIRLYNVATGVFCPEIVIPEEMLQEEE